MDPSVLTNMDIDMLIQTEINASEFHRVKDEVIDLLINSQNSLLMAKSKILTLHNAINSPNLNNYSPNRLVFFLHRQFIDHEAGLDQFSMAVDKYNELKNIINWSVNSKLRMPLACTGLIIETQDHIEDCAHAYREMRTAFGDSNHQGDATTRLIKSTLPQFYADIFFEKKS